MMSKEIIINNLYKNICENIDNITNLISYIRDKKLLKKLIELLSDYLIMKNEINNFFNKNIDFERISINKIKNEYNMMKKTMDFL